MEVRGFVHSLMLYVKIATGRRLESCELRASWTNLVEEGIVQVYFEFKWGLAGFV